MKNILIKPLITEKVATLNEKGRYGFVVATKANKVEIKKAIEKLYGVKVEEINTMIARGKTKSKQSKSGVLSGRTNSYKKAIVKVAEGEVIDIYSGI
jgi:large subunit ribosomal protein L23